MFSTSYGSERNVEVQLRRKKVCRGGRNIFFFLSFCFLSSVCVCVCVSECVCISLMDIRKIQVSYPAVLYQPTSYQLCVNQSPKKKPHLTY